MIGLNDNLKFEDIDANGNHIHNSYQYRPFQIVSILIWIPLIGACLTITSEVETKQVIHVLSGAGLIKPMDELKTAFEKKHQVKIVTHYGGAGELMGQLAIGQPGDVFIPGASKYIEDASKNGWIKKKTVRDIVKHIPVIAVAYGNPKRIRTLEDLAQPGMTIALGDPKACAIGRLANAIFLKNSLKDKLAPCVKVSAPTVNQLLLYVTLWQADAAIIWEDMASWSKSRQKLSVIGIPDEKNIEKTISTAVIARSRNPEFAQKFNTFVDSDAGHRIWSKWGFHPCTK